MNERGSREWTMALLLVLAVVVIWGFSFAATRIAVATVPPLTAATLRFALAAMVLWPVVRHRWGSLRLDRRDRRDGVVLGLTGVTLAFFFENIGLRYTTASHGALIVSTAPLATAAVEAFLARRMPGLRTLGGFSAALAGVALIVGRSGSAGATWYGDLLVLGTVFCWVAYSFTTRRLVRKYPTLVVTQIAMVIGTLCLLPLAAGELLFVPLGKPDVAAAVAIVYLGVMASALAARSAPAKSASSAA